MDESNLEDFNKTLMAISKYYKEPLEKFIAELWFCALIDFAYDDVKNALLNWIRTPAKHNAFMPKIADIVETLQGSIDEEAIMAWHDAHEAVRRIGAYESPCFENLIIGEIIYRYGGWIKFCETTTDKEIPFIQKRFVEDYKAYAKHEDDLYDRKLKGRTELGNGHTFKQVFIEDSRIYNKQRLKLLHKDGINGDDKGRQSQI